MSAPRFGVMFWIRGLENNKRWELRRFLSTSPGRSFSLKDELQRLINDGSIDKIEQYFNNDEMRKEFSERHLEILRALGEDV